jgi:hypothetical protein
MLVSSAGKLGAQVQVSQLQQQQQQQHENESWRRTTSRALLLRLSHVGSIPRGVAISSHLHRDASEAINLSKPLMQVQSFGSPMPADNTQFGGANGWQSSSSSSHGGMVRRLTMSVASAAKLSHSAHQSRFPPGLSTNNPLW